MFSLIFAIISIGLVVALAAGTMYYLSVSSDKHAKEAAAAGLLTQGEQIVAAIDMRSVTAEGDLTNLQQLVARNYLSSMPTPAAGTYAEGLVAKDSDWWLLAPGMLPAVMLQNKLDAETCLAVNRKLGLEGIKSKPDATRRIQCFGDAAPYTLVLNPSAKADVLGPAIESWNRCVADPTSPSCTTATAQPEPFCVANPTNAACTTSTSTPTCVADPTNALCVVPPDPGKSFCELHPANALCMTTPEPQPTCVVDPTNALCLVPPDATPFCELNPAHTACSTLIPAPLCSTDPTHAYCVTTPAPAGIGGGSYCEAPLGCKYCWMSNPLTGYCLTMPSGEEPTIPFVLPEAAKTLLAPELNGGEDSCVPVVKESSGGYAIKSSCNASWCQNAIDGGSLIIYGTKATGLYGCKPSGATTLPVCTLDIAAETLFAQPNLLINFNIAEWVNSADIRWNTDLGWGFIYFNTPTWSYYPVGPAPYGSYTDIESAVSAGVFSDLPLCGPGERLFVSPPWGSAPVNNIIVQCGTEAVYPLPTLSDFKPEILEYGIVPENLLSSLPSDVCTPPNK